MNLISLLNHGSHIEPIILFLKFLLLVFAFPLGSVWLYAVIANNLNKDKTRFEFVFNVNLLIGILFSMLLLIILFSFEIYITGIHNYTWSLFPFSLKNVYIQILPELVSFIALILMYVIINKKLTTIKKR